MHKKTTVLFSALIVVALVYPFAFSKADKPDLVLDLPEAEGVYAVPNHPNLKLRVFVHSAKGQSGKPTVTPTEVCASSSVVDPDSSAVVHPAGWNLPSIWEYQLNLSSAPSSIGSVNMGEIARNAFADWEGAVSSSVTIFEGAPTVADRALFDGQNIITWGRTSGTALAVSYIWYDQITGVAKEVDTIFNKKFKWYWSNPDTWPAGEECAFQGVYDAENILTHELGHTMGLDDEYGSEYANNTMYGYGDKTETKKDTLTSGDILGVQALY